MQGRREGGEEILRISRGMGQGTDIQPTSISCQPLALPTLPSLVDTCA